MLSAVLLVKFRLLELQKKKGKEGRKDIDFFSEVASLSLYFTQFQG